MAPRRKAAAAAAAAAAKSKRRIKPTAKAQAQAPPQRRRAAVSPELPPTTPAQAGDAPVPRRRLAPDLRRLVPRQRQPVLQRNPLPPAFPFRPSSPPPPPPLDPATHDNPRLRGIAEEEEEEDEDEDTDRLLVKKTRGFSIVGCVTTSMCQL